MHNAYSFENLEARVTALTSEQNPMTAILTQNEAREVWIAFNALKSAKRINLAFRDMLSDAPSIGVIVYTSKGKIHVKSVDNYRVKAEETYPSILALATRYGLTR